MNRLKRFALRRPFLFGLSMIFVYALLTTVSYPVHYFFPDSELGLLYGDAASKAITFLVLLTILWRFGWLRASGLGRIGAANIWLPVLLILLYKGATELYAFTGSFTPLLPTSAYTRAQALYYFPASIVEETIYRALVLIAMVSEWGDSRRGIIKSVLLSSLLFGMLHLLNIIVNPMGAGLVLLQALIVSLPGIFYAAIVLSGQSLWPAIVMHWLTNAAVNVKIASIDGFLETPTMWWIWALSLLPTVLYSAYVIWRLPAPYTLKGMDPNQEAGSA